MSTAILKQIYSEFPSVIAQNRKNTLFRWLLEVAGCPVLIRFECPHFPSTTGLKVLGDEDALFLLQGSQEELDALYKVSDTIPKFMSSLKRMFDQLVLDNPGLKGGVSSLGDVNQSCQVLSQLETVGWENVGLVSPDLAQIELKYKDERDKSHILRLSIPPNYPANLPTVSANLPDDWEAPSTSSILSIYSTWVEAVQSYIPAWEALKELDRNCWVLDPDPPTFSHLFRRLVLATSVSLHVTVDASNPAAVPVLRFLGADALISPLRQSLSENLELWDESDPLLMNLERVLGVELPCPAHSSRDEWSVECGICYSYRLDDRLPNKTCDDTRCCQPFHDTCLFEWLRTLPNARSTLNTVFGECPYCSRPIQCQRPI